MVAGWVSRGEGHGVILNYSHAFAQDSTVCDCFEGIGVFVLSGHIDRVKQIL